MSIYHTTRSDKPFYAETIAIENGIFTVTSINYFSSVTDSSGLVTPLRYWSLHNNYILPNLILTIYFDGLASFCIAVRRSTWK
jgi:hypothetical protein